MAPTPALDPARFELLTFDCYGTLVDWERGICAAAKALGEARGVTATAAEVLAGFAEHEHAVQAEPYRRYRDVLGLVWGRMGEAMGFRPTAAERAAFGASVGEWPPFPDTVEALRRLAARYRLGIVSNVDDDLFAATAEKLDVRFDWVVTAEQVRSYKPAPAHFHEMERRSGIPRARTLHVAQSRFHDVAPAAALGYATLWVNRPSLGAAAGATPPSAAEPTAWVAGMTEAADALAGGREPDARPKT